MFDTLKIESRFTKGLIERLIKRHIKKSMGKDVKIHIEELSGVIDDNNITFHVNADLSMTKETLESLLKL